MWQAVAGAIIALIVLSPFAVMLALAVLAR